MRWIVDGMNLIGSRPDGWWRDRQGARRRLAAELGRFARAQGERVEVVFDGRPGPAEAADAEAAGVAVTFAPGGPDAADRVIAELARTAPEPAGTTVVTSDAGLATTVRATGVAVIGVSGFRRLLET